MTKEEQRGLALLAALAIGAWLCYRAGVDRGRREVALGLERAMRIIQRTKET